MFEVTVKIADNPDLNYTKTFENSVELRKAISPRFWGIVSDPDFYSFEFTTTAPYSISIKKI